jgi:leucyl aminopeptidase
VEGGELTQYRFERYLKKSTDRLSFVVVGAPEDKREVSAGIKYAASVVAGACLTRDLVNTPAGDMTPEALAKEARKIARNHKSVSCSIKGPDWIAKQGMGAYAAVGFGSDYPQQFIELTYKSNKKHPTVAIVGKGVTFDSGGLGIKSSDGMRNMKCDMGGSAVVLGVFRAIAELKPNVNVKGYVAATENMTGGSAYKPGDILKTRKGLTIEIEHTDAEGRLTLIDALDYAAESKPDYMIDLATLTGAAAVATGPTIAPIMGTDQDLIDDLIACGASAGESIWQLPLEDSYRSSYKGDISDIKNRGHRMGGAITAALILSEFVPDSIPWAHIDIAGPTFGSDKGPYIPKGGSGFGTRTLINFLRQF